MRIATVILHVRTTGTELDVDVEDGIPPEFVQNLLPRLFHSVADQFESGNVDTTIVERED